MYKTNQNNQCNSDCEKMLVDTDELKYLLSLGRESAIYIGEQAKAKVSIGKRVVWNIKKIQEYLDEVSTN